MPKSGYHALLRLYQKYLGTFAYTWQRATRNQRQLDTKNEVREQIGILSKKTLKKLTLEFTLNTKLMLLEFNRLSIESCSLSIIYHESTNGLENHSNDNNKNYLSFVAFFFASESIQYRNVNALAKLLRSITMCISCSSSSLLVGLLWWPFRTLRGRPPWSLRSIPDKQMHL